MKVVKNMKYLLVAALMISSSALAQDKPKDTEFKFEINKHISIVSMHQYKDSALIRSQESTSIRKLVDPIIGLRITF